MLAGHPGDEKGWYLRRIGEGFVIIIWQIQNNRLRLLRRHVKLGMIRSQMSGHGLGVFCLVVTFLIETDREGADGFVSLCLHERNDKRRIDPTG